MRHVTRLALPVIVAISLLTFASTAQAGEPFYPIWDPFGDFFRFLGWF